MGNTASVQRQESQQRDSRHHSGLTLGESTEARIPQGRDETSTSATPENASQPQTHDAGSYGTFRREISAQSAVLESDAGTPIGTDQILYEQEERPLVSMGDLGMRDAPITHITATPIARRPSTMSRLGSRILPNSVARGLLSSGEETEAEGRAHRTGIIPRLPSVYNRRFFLRSSSRNTSLSSSSSSSYRRRPPRGQHLPEQAESFSSNLSSRPESDIPLPTRNSWRRNARFSLRRHSLSLFPNLLSERPSSSQRSNLPTDDADHLIPPMSTIDHRFDFDEAPHELDGTSVEARNILSSSEPASSRPLHPTNSLRRLPQSLRSRSSTRLIRRGDQPPLSQVLHLAAAAIAAQLSGGQLSALQPIAAEGFDGNLNNFVQTLQDAATSQANEGTNNPVNIEGHENQGAVNFLRVFQFPNTEGVSPMERGNDETNSHSGATNDSGRMDIDDPPNQTGDTPERMVTLVVVGVRSVPQRHDGASDSNNTDDLGPSLDTLLNLPFLPPSNLFRGNTQGALLRRTDGRSRNTIRRRSITNFDSFPMQYESQRHHRTRSSASRSDAPSWTSPTSNLPTVLSESPPGPNPPPSTPAEPGRSGANTPIRRPSSAGHASVLPFLEEDPASQSNSENSNLTAFSAARQRRRSDSEFARRPELSSGATRRNGVVGPDETTTSPGRSWLIYVVGTSVSPDHPAFTMPSLFTDNPSYEDMQLLSTLLGPVKPPVATQADVTSSGGIYRLIDENGTLTATPTSPDHPPARIILNERCLICLCDYERSEEIRQLSVCKHVYHRECIDEAAIPAPFAGDKVWPKARAHNLRSKKLQHR
ncbi:MAG: hypothetical protein Q9160_004197 [Pyrenula sp. 1 TL-2023]